MSGQDGTYSYRPAAKNQNMDAKNVLGYSTCRLVDSCFEKKLQSTFVIHSFFTPINPAYS
jgi:hypothetical protein